MYRNADRDEDDDTDRPDSYWRRRAITLAAGLSLLGLLAWAFSGGGGKPANPMPGNSPTPGVLPAAAYSSAPASPSDESTGSASFAANPKVSGLPSAEATQPSATPAASGRAGATKAQPEVTPTGDGVEPDGGCSPGALVLSLFTSRPEYDGGQYPVFDVYAVSTASQDCSVDMGPAKLHVVVLSAGRIIWDSADCAHGDPSRVTELGRGVPAQESVTWNRTINLPGCVTLASAARPGSYQVQARTATAASPVRTFKLVGLALADA